VDNKINALLTQPINDAVTGKIVPKVSQKRKSRGPSNNNNKIDSKLRQTEERVL